MQASWGAGSAHESRREHRWKLKGCVSLAAGPDSFWDPISLLPLIVGHPLSFVCCAMGQRENSFCAEIKSYLYFFPCFCATFFSVAVCW